MPVAGWRVGQRRLASESAAAAWARRFRSLWSNRRPQLQCVPNPVPTPRPHAVQEDLG